MKIRIKFFCIVSLIILSFGFISDDDKTIGKNGIASLMIDSSNLKDVRKVFPNGKRGVRKVQMQGRGYACTAGRCIEIKGKKHTVRFVNYVDEQNGLEFYLGKYDNLKSISFFRPTKYKTNKGIGVGDNFYDLDSLYGQGSWCRHISGNCKIYGNLRFFPNDSLKKATLTTDELNKLDVRKISIEEIVLFGSSTE